MPACNDFRAAITASLTLAATATMGARYALADTGAIPPPPDKRYQRVFTQDFTTLKTLAVAPHEIGTGTWIAHTPSYTDWFTFQDPGAPGHPFLLGDGYLRIRVQKDGSDPHNYFAGYSGGLLSSMDEHGIGFAQKYGYFEASMQTPGTPNTWPGFWLLDAPTLTDKSLPDGSEIDITESYGNFGSGPGQKPPGDPEQDGVAWHNWGHNGNPTKSGGTFAHGLGMTTGFHTYGVDIEPDNTTWYFDRKQVWQVPTYAASRRPMFVLVNLALGGGSHNNADGSAYDWNLTPLPTDLKVKYIAVWASPNSPNYKGKPAAPTGVVATSGDGKVALAWTGGGQTFTVYRGTSAGDEQVTPLATGLSAAACLDTTAKNGVRYFYRIASVNPYGVGSRSVEVSALPGVGAGASVAFVKTDTTTKGDWRSAYGADGWRVMGDKKGSVPSDRDPLYATVRAATEQTFTWAPSTDLRALQKASTPGERIVAELHADKTVTLDIDVMDGKTHPVALYFLDWDGKGEIDEVKITDAVFGNVLDTRPFSHFGGGVYGVWNVKGHVTVTITNAAPNAANSQATLSGLFFGGAGTK